MLRRRRNHAGFTIIELLIVVAIIAILAAIAINNYLNAISRARQKRTIADMRTIAQAWEARASEAQTYTAAGFSFPTPLTYTSLELALTPTYAKNLPKVDGWGHPFEFGATGRSYAIRSPGRDGVYEGSTYSTGQFTSPDCDIVYSMGNFVRYPEQIQED